MVTAVISLSNAAPLEFYRSHHIVHSDPNESRHHCAVTAVTD